VLFGADYNDAQARDHEIEETEGRTYVHAFDDKYVMAGQGTMGLEIAEACPEVDTVVVPIGGGGLISGIATALKASVDDVRVVGVQAEGASSVAHSLEKGKRHELDQVDTIADGIATRSVGEKPWEIIQKRVDDVVTVSDNQIALALTYLLERSKTLVEGAGAVALAAVLGEAFDYEEGETIVPALCGGNIDLNDLTTVVVRGLVQMGRYIKIRTELKDNPGSLERLVEIIADHNSNIYGIQHDRTSRDVAMNAAEVVIDLETHGHDHIDELLAALESRGYRVETLV